MEENILQAAEALFLENGFSATSTTQIAQKAGCTQAMVNYYFRTKDKLFGQIFLRKAQELISMFTSSYQPECSFCDNLSKMVGVHFDMLSNSPQLPLFIFQELNRSPEKVRFFIEVFQTKASVVFQPMDQMRIEAIQKKEIRDVSLLDILFSSVSLNAFFLIGMAVLQKTSFALSQEEQKKWFESRKKEHIATIINGLRPF